MRERGVWDSSLLGAMLASACQPCLTQGEPVAAREVDDVQPVKHPLVVTSPTVHPLADFAQLLKLSPLELTHAMCMDGGYEAELCVRAGRFRYASFGPWA